MDGNVCVNDVTGIRYDDRKPRDGLGPGEVDVFVLILNRASDSRGGRTGLVMGPSAR
jgi:hypothetical protein